MGLKELLDDKGKDYFRANMKFALLESWSMRTDDAYVLERESYGKEVLHARSLGHNNNQQQPAGLFPPRERHQAVAFHVECAKPPHPIQGIHRTARPPPPKLYASPVESGLPSYRAKP